MKKKMSYMMRKKAHDKKVAEWKARNYKEVYNSVDKEAIMQKEIDLYEKYSVALCSNPALLTDHNQEHVAKKVHDIATELVKLYHLR